MVNASTGQAADGRAMGVVRTLNASIGKRFIRYGNAERRAGGAYGVAARVGFGAFETLDAFQPFGTVFVIQAINAFIGMRFFGTRRDTEFSVYARIRLANVNATQADAFFGKFAIFVFRTGDLLVGRTHHRRVRGGGSACVAQLDDAGGNFRHTKKG